MTAPWTVHGLDLSYFTGKLEATLRVKGVPYRLVEMDTAGFARCARLTGVRQMPQVALPDGTWATDTTCIIDWMEREAVGPPLDPQEETARFLARLIEDFGDEALWRPALHYRWSFADDARLMSRVLAAGMLRDVPLPLFVRRQMILRRQRRHYVAGDGITPATRGAVEALYRDTLAAMEEALADAPFIQGGRPTRADLGLFGPFFRHFASDPTPARILRAAAPRTLSWVARIWAGSPAILDAGSPPTGIAPGLAGFAPLIARHHLPELDGHAQAVAAGAARARFEAGGAPFDIAASPYRAWCLDVLREGFAALGDPARTALSAWLGADATRRLAAPRQPVPVEIPRLPIRPGDTRVRTRAWTE